MALEVVVQNASSEATVPDPKLIQHWASAALSEPQQEVEISLRIVDEEEGRSLNHTWRNKDYPTNVLSFPVGEPIEQAPGLLGDMVICAPIVAREANEQGKTIEAHWAHLVVHGMLHLQGYDHEQQDEAEKMEALEISILDKIGYANPYEPSLKS